MEEQQTDATTESSEESRRFAALAEQLAGMERQLSEFHRRAEHRETVIDRLHAENQVLRGGIRRSILDPVVTDLMRLYVALGHEAERLAGEPVGPLFASFADDVELALERCGCVLFRPDEGEPFEPARHTPAGTVPTGDGDLHNTVQKVLGAGFTDQETGRIRRPARVRFWQQQQQPQPVPEPVPAESE
jgi:molecular chaperone GrpE